DSPGQGTAVFRQLTYLKRRFWKSPLLDSSLQTRNRIFSNQKRGCVGGGATQLVRSYALSLILYPAPMSARICRSAIRLRPESAEHNTAATVSNYQRASD